MNTNKISKDCYQPIEVASRDEIEALQLERLQWSLNHAYQHVHHYRKVFEQHGCHPDDLKHLEDLSRFPFTTKADLRDNYPFGMFAVPREQVVRVHASSGTTGIPTVVGYTKKDIDTWATLVARSIYAAGGRAGDICQVSYGYGLFTGGLGAHYGAEKLGCTVVPMSGGRTENQVKLIYDFKPSIIMVTPSYFLNIMEKIDSLQYSVEECPLRIGIFGAEPWTDAMRQTIEQRMGMDAVDIYGLSEVMGPGVAQECLESKDGPTIWEDHFYPEIIDPDTEESLPDGSEGELVFTSLSKEAFPIIRYRTRDITCLLDGSARTMRRMKRITGRSDDMLIIHGVNIFPSQIEEYLLQQPGLSPHYQLKLEKTGSLHSLIVRVEPDGLCANEYKDAAAKLKREIKSYIGVSVTVEVCAVGSIPRSEGKAQRIINKH